MGGTVRSDDDWMSTTLNLANGAEVAAALNCTTTPSLRQPGARGQPGCLQGKSLAELRTASELLRFAPAMAVEGQYPLGQIRRGLWTKVPVIVGGQSCEACYDAESALGPYTETGVTQQEFGAALAKHGFRCTFGSMLRFDWDSTVILGNQINF